MSESRVALMSLILAVAACSDLPAHRPYNAPGAAQGAEGTPEPEPPARVATSNRSSSASSSLLDAQIVRLADVLDTAAVEQGSVAISRARDPRVQAFAQRMIRQHSENLRHAAMWQRRAGVLPEESSASDQFQSEARSALHALEDVHAAGFDATFVQSRVQLHERALDMLDRQLIPNATHPELREQLQLRRTVVANHLADARQLHRSLGN